MQHSRRRLMAVTLILCLIFCMMPTRTLMAENFTIGQGYTKEEIIAKWTELKPTTGANSAFAAYGSTTSPYATAVLTQEAVANGLNTWNFARWLVGLQDVTLSRSANDYMALSALVNGATGGISHTPQRPSDMTSDLYMKGYDASQQANLSYISTYPAGYTDNPRLIHLSILRLLWDSASNTIEELGHRRWLLDPQMTAAGFGAVYHTSTLKNNQVYGNAYIAIQVQGLPKDPNQTKASVFWPAPGYFPIELFQSPRIIPPDKTENAAWSVMLDASYSNLNTDGIKITMMEEGGGSIILSPQSVGANLFNVSTTAAGSSQLCLIFMPGKLSPAAGKVYHVAISGLVKASDHVTPAPNIEYDVAFFSLDETLPPPVAVTGITLSESRKILLEESSFTLASTVAPADATNKRVVWSSSDPDVASIENGVVTAHSAGTAIITAAAADGGHTASCAVTVKATARTSVNFNETKAVPGRWRRSPLRRVLNRLFLP